MNLVYKSVKRYMNKVNKVASEFRFFIPFNDIFEEAFKYDSYKVHGYGYVTRGHELIYNINFNRCPVPCCSANSTEVIFGSESADGSNVSRTIRIYLE